MPRPPEVDPIAWAQLTPNAQRLLSGHPLRVSVNLWFNDDGTPAQPPERLGFHLGMLLVSTWGIMTAMECAAEFTAALCRKYP